MKFIVSSNVLLKALQSISGVLSTNSTLPILDNYLFSVLEGNLNVTASDIETTMSVSVPLVKVEEEGNIAIPARILLDTLKTFGDIPISFFINLETKLIELSTDDGKFKLSGFDGAEFPNPPAIEGVNKVEMPAEVLEQAISKTIFATGSDELRPVMMGVSFELTGEGLILVGTDAHKLVKYTRKDIISTSEDSFIIPKKSLSMLKNTLGKAADNVSIEYDAKNAIFTFENFKLICRLVDGKYPNYEAVIPKDNPNILTVDRIQLLNKIRRVSFFANQSTNQIRLKISGKELILSAEDMDYTNEAYERLTCSYQGEDIEIGFNAKFLIEMLNNLSNEEITIELSSPGRAGIIVPVNKDDANEHIIMLVMPIMLNN